MKKFTLTVLGCFVLAGCSGVSDQLGLKKQAPDEFAVVKRAPLQLPPNYTLRPPTPGAQRPQEQRTSDAARETLLGKQERIYNSDGSSGEKALLGQIGANEAEPDIRQTLERETGIIGVQEQSVAERLLSLDSKPKEHGTVLDPYEESQRIKDELASEQKTPVIEKR